MEAPTIQNNLLEGIRARDKNAVAELYQSFFQPCSKIVLKDGGTIDDAREVFQEAIFSLMVKLQNADFTIKSNLKGYMNQSCFNLWVNSKRKSRKISSTDTSPLEIADTGDEIEEKEEKERQFEQMNDCLQKGTGDCKKLLELSFYKKLSDEKIAPLMNYSQQFVRNKRRRCMTALKKCMGVGI